MVLTCQALLPVALVFWLLPLSRLPSFPSPDADFGNWGCSRRLNSSPITAKSSKAICRMVNSLLITVPTVIGAVVLSSMTGFALGIYKFRGNLAIFFLFIAGNFVPFQILMVPVRDLTVNLGLYDTKMGLVLFHIAFQTGFCTLFMRNFIRALPLS